MRRRDFLGVCGGVMAATLPLAPARADTANMGLLEQYLLIGEEPPWKGSYAQGFYLLENQEGFNNTMTFAALSALPPQKVVLDVFAAGPGAYTGAGLLLNKEVRGGSYLGVTLEPAGTLGIYFYDPDGGIGRVTQFPALGLRSDVVTRLSCENSAAGIDILTNGTKSGHFSDIKLKGACGAMATDRGQFYMANFWMG